MGIGEDPDIIRDHKYVVCLHSNHFVGVIECSAEYININCN